MHHTYIHVYIYTHIYTQRDMCWQLGICVSASPRRTVLYCGFLSSCLATNYYFPSCLWVSLLSLSFLAQKQPFPHQSPASLPWPFPTELLSWLPGTPFVSNIILQAPVLILCLCQCILTHGQMDIPMLWEILGKGRNKWEFALWKWQFQLDFWIKAKRRRTLVNEC